MSNTSIIQEEEAHACENLKQFSEHVAVIADLVNSSDVIRMLRWLHRPGYTFEIRTLKSQTDKYAGTSCGYFRDFDTAVEAVVEHVGQYHPAQVYVSLNPTTPDLYARARDRIKTKQKAMAKNEDIIRIRNILIDCDPVRPPGIPSSSSELDAAKETMQTIRAWLCEQGWPVPLIGMSGNGYHLVYAVDLNVDEDSHRLVKDLIEVLATRFDNDVVQLDKSVHNPGRVCKLYGTFSIKGDGADDRVNRMSCIVEYPDRVEISLEMLQAVIDELSPDVKLACQTPSCGTSSHRGINLIKFLDNRHISRRDVGNGKFILDQCAFDPDHSNGEVAVFQNPNGSTAYHCFHDSCTGKGWQQFTQVVGRVTKDDWDEPLTSWTTDSTEKITKHIAPTSDQRPVDHSTPPFELIPSQEIAARCGAQKPGFWGNIIEAGMMTLFVGPEKSGKSTFLHTLYRYFSTGGDFVYPVKRCKVTVCSEESHHLWKQYHDLNEWDDDAIFFVPCDRFVTLQPCKRRDEFRNTIEALGESCAQAGVEIIVFDTFRKLFPLDSYDDAAQVKKVLDPVRSILCQRYALAVVIVHHAKKNAKECSSPTAISSGSNHLPAEADKIAIFSRDASASTRRKLCVIGRLVQGEYVFEFDELNHIYRPILGDDSEKYKDTNHKIWNLVPREWTPSKDIIQRAIDIGVKKSTVYSALRVGDQERYLDSRNVGEKNAKEYRRTEVPIQSMLVSINGQQD